MSSEWEDPSSSSSPPSSSSVVNPHPPPPPPSLPPLLEDGTATSANSSTSTTIPLHPDSSSHFFATCSPHSTEQRSFRSSSSESSSAPTSPPQPHPPSSISLDTFHTPSASVHTALTHQQEEDDTSSPEDLSSPIKEIIASTPEEDNQSIGGGGLGSSSPMGSEEVLVELTSSQISLEVSPKQATTDEIPEEDEEEDFDKEEDEQRLLQSGSDASGLTQSTDSTNSSSKSGGLLPVEVISAVAAHHHPPLPSHRKGSMSTASSVTGKKKNWYSHIFSASYKSRSGDFKKLFKELPHRERLLVDYSCALQREILVQGRMYVSQGFVSFHANIFGWETQTVIRLKDIASITKEKTALVIPNAIQVATQGGDKFFFTSFVTRDATFLMLFKLWQSALLEDSMPSTEIQRLILSAYGEDLIITSEEEFDDTENPDSGGRLEKTRQETPHKLSPLHRSIGQVCATELGPALAVSGSLGSSILTSNSKGISSSTGSIPLVVEEPTSLPLAIDLSDSSDSDDDDDEDFVHAEDEDDFGGPVACPVPHSEGRENLNAVFPCHIDALFTMLFTNSKFYLDLHTSRNTFNVRQSAWDEDKETSSKRRVVSMTVSLSNVMGPKHSHVTETQVMLPSSRPGAFYGIDSESVNAGIPYADAFAVTIHYCLSRISSSETRLVVVNNIKYKKSVWGITKSIIEKNCWAGMEEFYSHLGRALAEECAKMSLGASPVPSPKKQGGGGVGQIVLTAGSSGSLQRRRPQRKTKGKAPDVPPGVVPLHVRSALRNGSIVGIVPQDMIMNAVVGHGHPLVAQGEGGDSAARASSAIALKVILTVLVGLLLLNGFLFLKLNRLETVGPSFISPQTFTFTGELPQSHADWLTLLQKQEALHRVELQKWHDILISALRVLQNAESDLEALKQHISTYGEDKFSLEDATSAATAAAQESESSSREEEPPLVMPSTPPVTEERRSSGEL